MPLVLCQLKGLLFDDLGIDTMYRVTATVHDDNCDDIFYYRPTLPQTQLSTHAAYKPVRASLCNITKYGQDMKHVNVVVLNVFTNSVYTRSILYACSPQPKIN